MSNISSSSLFNTIAPIYGLFYHSQKGRFRKVIGNASKLFELTTYENILDVGCGTGALCSVLNEKGLAVTGIDPAEEMLKIAKRHPENKKIKFIQANALEALPFGDKSFDISIASYVAHGMQKNERKRLYVEMSRVTKNKVIIYDYNQNRAIMTSVVEWLERGDYFRFIKEAENEMKNCFSEVKVINVDTRAAWYICTPLH